MILLLKMVGLALLIAGLGAWINHKDNQQKEDK